MFPILPSTAWLEFRGKPSSHGQNLTTHQALIAGPNGQEHRCFVKFSPVGNPMPLTEAIGWMIAEALDLPRPKFAALVMIPLGRLRPHLPLDQHWMLHQEALGFCCSAVDGKHLTGRWRWLRALRQAKAFKHPDVSRIAAFDTWVENQDRHSGNLLKTANGGYTPIDNEAILHSTVWAQAQIQFVHHSIRSEARQLLNRRSYTQFESNMVLASDHHAAAFHRGWPDVQTLLQKMVADPTMQQQLGLTLKDFLEARAASGWLATELGQIP